MGFSESSIFLKISLVVLPLGLLFLIIGISTPNWSTSNFSTVSAQFGLWKYCLSTLGVAICKDYADITITDDDWIKACQAMGILGVLTLVAAITLNVLCVTVLTKQTHKMAFILALTLAFIGAVWIFMANIIWGAKSSDWPLISRGTDVALSWSFALALVGGIFAVAGGVLIGVGFTQD